MTGSPRADSNDTRYTQQDQYDEFYDSSNDSNIESLSWITWFCALSGHEYFAEVAEEFIEDDFNLTGLPNFVPYYKEALEMILDIESEEDSVKVPDVTLIENSAELLYGLIHQRYIITRQGLQQMADKYDAGHFGYCPRTYCRTTPVVPCGRYDLPGMETVKLFCPSCLDIYNPSSSRYQDIDGAYFGTTFPHFLFHTYPELLPRSSSKIYTARIFGFRVSEKSWSGPRMRWLRELPPNEENENEESEEEEEEDDEVENESEEEERVGAGAERDDKIIAHEIESVTNRIKDEGDTIKRGKS
ncbi:uncharacterized protein VTP21DRAFT_7739 [Calcarisporiella thermophila]|uniref:uncharacterized protein n=1 Tax=Calcarisporiella thermophila TaxID=911321 RepID=UPI0037432901